MDKQAKNSSSAVQIYDELLNRTRDLQEYEAYIVDRLNSLKDRLNDRDQAIAQHCDELRHLGKATNETYHELLVEAHNKNHACTHIHKCIEQAQAIEQTLALVSEQTLQHTNAFQIRIKTKLQRLENEVKSKENLQRTDILLQQQEIENLQRCDEQAQSQFDEELEKLNEEIAALQAVTNAQVERGVNLSARIADAQIEYENLENVLKVNNERQSELQNDNKNMSEEIQVILDKKSDIENRLQNKVLEIKNIDEDELKISESMLHIQQEIADIDIKNEQLKNHEIYETTARAFEAYNVRIEAFGNDISCAEHSLAKSVENHHKISEEIEKLNAQIEQREAENNNLKEKIAHFKKGDVKKAIEEEKCTIESLTSQSAASNLDVVKLRFEIKELQSTLSEMKPLNIESTEAIYEEIAKLKKTTKDNETETIIKKKQYLDKIENEIAAGEKETIDKLAQLDEEMSTIKNDINQLLLEKKNSEFEFQGKLLECDVFKKKVKDAEKERDKLKIPLELPKPPPGPKRSIDDGFDSDASSYKNLSTFQERLNYKKKKLAPKRK